MECALVLLLVIVSSPLLVDCSLEEHRLLESLMFSYVKEERPVFEEENSVQLTISLDLRQILDLDEKNQVEKYSTKKDCKNK